MVRETPEQLIQQLCGDLRLLRRQAGGPSLRELSARVGLGKSQLGAILNGAVRTLPDWDVVQALVESFHRYAEEHGRLPAGSLRANLDGFWRPRYSMVEHAVTAEAPAPPVVPRQLPPAVPHFAGRTAELAALTALLDLADATAIAAVDGMAGVGKTTLAVRWAHRVADRFPDGQLYLNLRGFAATGHAMTPEDALRDLLDALRVAPRRIPARLDAQVGLYRSLLAGKRVLLVLDNARDAEQVRPLLPAASGCLAVVTSRTRLSSLIAAEGARPLGLEPLPAAEARRLFTDRLGAGRVAAHPGAVDAVIDRCAGLPLALSIVAARAAAAPRLPLDLLAAQLDEARHDLAALSGWDDAVDVRTVFSWSYRSLTPAAARLFRLLGLHPGPDSTAPAAASLAGIPPRQVRPALAELTRANLLTERIPGRYALHDLLRAYAAELAESEDAEADRREALRRMLDHYLHSAYSAAVLVDPQRDPIELPPLSPGTVPELLRDHDAAPAWLTAEHQVLVAVIRTAAARGFAAHVCPLAWTVVQQFVRRGYWHDLLAVQRLAVETAQRLGDRPGEADAHRFLARAHAWLGRYDEATAELRRALAIFTDLGDRVGEAHVHTGLSWVAGLQEDYERALRHALAAAARYRSTGHKSGLARALNGVGWHYALMGRYRDALTACHEAIALLETVQDRASLGLTWHSVGYAHRHLGNHAEAIAAYERALPLFVELDDRYDHADTLVHMGDTYAAAGDQANAASAWRQALTMLTELDHPDAEAVAERLEAGLPAAPGEVRPG